MTTWSRDLGSWRDRPSGQLGLVGGRSSPRHFSPGRRSPGRSSPSEWLQRQGDGARRHSPRAARLSEPADQRKVPYRLRRSQTERKGSAARQGRCDSLLDPPGPSVGALPFEPFVSGARRDRVPSLNFNGLASPPPARAPKGGAPLSAACAPHARAISPPPSLPTVAPTRVPTVHSLPPFLHRARDPFASPLLGVWLRLSESRGTQRSVAAAAAARSQHIGSFSGGVAGGRGDGASGEAGAAARQAGSSLLASPTGKWPFLIRF